VILLNHLPWQHIMAIIAVITIVSAFAFYRYCDCGDFPGQPPGRQVLKAVLRLPSFWIMVILFSLFLGGAIGLYSMLSLYLIREAGMSADLANSLVGVSRLTGLFTVFLSGMMMDRIGEKKHIVLIMFTSGLSTILIGTTTGGMLTAMIFIQTTLLGCFPTAGFSAMARIVQPNKRSVASSFITPIATVIGGTHLITADIAYLQHVVTVLRNEYGPLDFYPNHCTGEQAFLALAKAFGHRTHSCPAGTVLTFD
jgi:predicted MFS family arabinose efflux permease